MTYRGYTLDLVKGTWYATTPTGYYVACAQTEAEAKTYVDRHIAQQKELRV